MKIDWQCKVDLMSCKNLLKQYGLPVKDITENSFASVVSGYYQNQLVGFGGLEFYDQDVLLRSLVVQNAFQGKGIAKSIVSKLLNVAELENKRDCFLLTNTAVDFFKSQGFNVVERHNVPKSIKSSEEFSQLCPASAVVMYKTLKCSI